MTLANLPGIAWRGVIDDHKEADGRRPISRHAEYPLLRHLPEDAQSVAAATSRRWCSSKWLFAHPQVLILDEPTRGIDVGAKYEIYTIINDLAAAGKGVIVISSEMPELLGICDRIYVMNEGRFVDEMPAKEATQEKIMASIMKQYGAVQ